ncbi:NACHT domain-containing protein [Nonomuraea diastatica]|uniref:NACHT domain-containing protein n=1 Tax=Nonomuraea diastatica TaxID=1848329 RepID=A0A4R4WTL4_9ACTN|nr:NACHT domain-containing protein [Nonomuraea diastatica]TDD20954.1 NACHT domain-containing protein [Nonomuraea diastatica]
MVGERRWRAWLLWLSMVLAPVGVSVAANQVLNDGVWSGPWVAGTIVAAVVAGLIVERAGRVLAPTPGNVTETMRELAQLVNDRWSDEVVTRSLGDPPIPVSWHMTRRTKLMDHPHLVADREPAVSGRSDDIAALAVAFRALRRRRLVITGGPGTGKTTLAIQLMLELIRTRADNEPVPVLLAVADWDIKAHPRFQDWVAERVRTDYAALRTPGNQQDGADILAARGSILAILDGLDELPEPARAKVIEKLSDTLMERDQVIVTSRTTEYGKAVTAARRPLKAAAVIAPKALPPDIVADFLSSQLPPPSPSSAWTKVLCALREGAAPALADVTSTALGLWLVRVVYIHRPDADPAPLVTEYADDVRALRTHLLDNLLDALLNARTTIKPTPWDPAVITEWTKRLARLQAESGGHDLAWWRLTDQALPASRTRRALARTWIGWLSGLAFALPAALTATLTYGPVFGSAFGICFGLSATQAAARTPDFAPLRVRQRLRDFTRGLLSDARMIIYILPAGIGLPAVVYNTWAHGWKMGVAALFAALGIGWVTVRVLQQQDKKHAQADENRLPPFTAALTPQSTWRVNRSLLGVQLMNALLLGAIVGFAADFMNEASIVSPPSSASVHAGMGIVFGIAFGLVNKRQHMWLMSTIALAHLGPSDRLPFRLMRFLHDLHQLGVLRIVGPFYQFRHAELQDHLAAAKGTDHSR